MNEPRWMVSLTIVLLLAQVEGGAHSGPPYPIVSNQIVGAYDLSIWTDPDATDDGTPAGRFWLVLESAKKGVAMPADTRATVEIRPLDRQGSPLSGTASPEQGSASRQYITLLMDHEGPFGVRLTVDGPLGRADVEAQVDATYDARPAQYLIAVYLFPFLAIGAIWVKVLLRRRRHSHQVR
ncbi:MAG TPA: hypothetical protein VF491_06035 [Vicinamibacterales bacterium]